MDKWTEIHFTTPKSKFSTFANKENSAFTLFFWKIKFQTCPKNAEFEYIRNRKILFTTKKAMEDNENKTPATDTPADDNGGKEQEKVEKKADIPYSRFKEVNDEKKALQQELDKYKAEEKQREAEKQKADEEKAKQNGEYEKLIAQKDQEIEAFKKQQETWENREKAVSERNNQRIAELEKSFGDNWESTKALISDITDPFVLSTKLDSLEKLSWKKDTPKWWSDIPSSQTNGKLADFKARLEKGETLTANEQREYFRLAMASENK